MSARNGKITTGQIKKMHALKRALGWDDDLYHEILDDRYGVKSSTMLTSYQAYNFIKVFEQRAIELNVWTPGGAAKFLSLKSRNRKGYATDKQARLVDALWCQVSRQDDEKSRDKALRHFLKRLVGVDDIRFVERHNVEKIVKALEAMGAKYER